MAWYFWEVNQCDSIDFNYSYFLPFHLPVGISVHFHFLFVSFDVQYVISLQAWHLHWELSSFYFSLVDVFRRARSLIFPYKVTSRSARMFSIILRADLAGPLLRWERLSPSSVRRKLSSNRTVWRHESRAQFTQCSLVPRELSLEEYGRLDPLFERTAIPGHQRLRFRWHFYFLLGPWKEIPLSPTERIWHRNWNWWRNSNATLTWSSFGAASPNQVAKYWLVWFLPQRWMNWAFMSHWQLGLFLYSLSSEPMMVIIEYVPYGDLLGYLRKSRGLNDTYYKDPDVKPKTSLTSQQLTRFAGQVADGMSFLSSNKVGRPRNPQTHKLKTHKLNMFEMWSGGKRG